MDIYTTPSRAMIIRPFHAAFPVSSLKKTREFYSDILNCSIGRSCETWIDYNFFGHQITFHQVSALTDQNHKNEVDSKQIPVPHFGVILTMSAWSDLAKHLRSQKIKFIVEPHIRFKGQTGEQATMFFKDSNGYALEFKAFADDIQIFKT